VDDQAAADPDTTEGTSSAAEQPSSKQPRNPRWKVAEMNATIIRQTNEVENLNNAHEKAQRIHEKDPPAPPEGNLKSRMQAEAECLLHDEMDALTHQCI